MYYVRRIWLCVQQTRVCAGDGLDGYGEEWVRTGSRRTHEGKRKATSEEKKNLDVDANTKETSVRRLSAGKRATPNPGIFLVGFRFTVIISAIFNMRSNTARPVHMSPSGLKSFSITTVPRK